MQGSLLERPNEGRVVEPLPRSAAPAKSRWHWLKTLARVVTSLVLVVAILAAGWAYRQHLVNTQTATPRQTFGERPRAVESLVANVADIQPDLRLFGQIAAGRTVDLRMLVGGEVLFVAPEMVEGGQVEKGQVLVGVDRFDYDGALVRARTELAEAQAKLLETRARMTQERTLRRRAEEQREIALREVERLTTLQARGAVSTATLDTSKSRLSIARSSVELREQQILVLQATMKREQAVLDRLRWNVQKAERDIRNTRLEAPFSGILSNVAAQPGRLVNVNDRVATLVDLDRFEARFTLSDAAYGRLVAESGSLEGRPIKVLWRGGRAQLVASGVVDRISPVVSASTGGFDVYARLQRSAATEAMRPGAFVTVEMADVMYKNVVQVPQSAVHPGSKVFSIDEDGRLQPREVAVVGFDGADLLVRGDLQDGLLLMGSRLPDAGPGLRVKPRP